MAKAPNPDRTAVGALQVLCLRVPLSDYQLHVGVDRQHFQSMPETDGISVRTSLGSSLAKLKPEALLAGMAAANHFGLGFLPS